MKIAILGLSLLLATPAVAADRIEFFTKHGQRDGYAVINREQGRIDTYDKNSNRTGQGTIRRDGSIEIYSTGDRRSNDKGNKGGQRR
jgi:hypothetical protein